MISNSSFIFSFIGFEILQVLKELMIISSEILFYDSLTYPHISLSLAYHKFPLTVYLAPPLAIQRCHSLWRLSLNGLLIATSSG